MPTTNRLKTQSATFWVGLAALTFGSARAADPIEKRQDTITDFRGKSIRVSIKPTRIAALIPSLAELVVELGHGDSLIGAPEYSRLPKNINSRVQKLGPYNHISPEAVYAIKPDLVLASMDGNDPILIGQLEKLGLRIVVVNTLSLKQIVESIELVASALGETKNSKLRGFRSFLQEKKKQHKEEKRRTFVQVGWNPLVTISKKTFVHELLELAGGENVFANTAGSYPRPSAEEVIAANPDVIVICQLTESDTDVQKAVSFWKRFPQLNAVKNNAIKVIPGDWITKPTLNLERGIRELEHIFYESDSRRRTSGLTPAQSRLDSIWMLDHFDRSRVAVAELRSDQGL